MKIEKYLLPKELFFSMSKDRGITGSVGPEWCQIFFLDKLGS
jgi:hypothetical protein